MVWFSRRPPLTSEPAQKRPPVMYVADAALAIVSALVLTFVYGVSVLVSTPAQECTGDCQDNAFMVWMIATAIPIVPAIVAWKIRLGVTLVVNALGSLALLIFGISYVY
ncbi:hypothetical protein Aph01nite_41130 [Acrocarpospora phusangensis]|uniref:Uncharacterized protein n=1 Tax=Acrocarpospora phusangensis TaxID=1070424 RepID=A0A919UPX2_9ACTN|nr:hypothetical protein [Acrocarpospora phusangensis]GIH25803.1 hypothetical protein Aph01nite_41130 [Acrocarpospora phusangensis]